MPSIGLNLQREKSGDGNSLTIHFDPGETFSYGGVAPKNTDGETLWLWGDSGVFESFFAVRPETNAGVVYFTNSENGLSIGPEIVAETTLGQAASIRMAEARQIT